MKKRFPFFVEMFRVSSFLSNKANPLCNTSYVIDFHVQVGLHESNLEFHIISHKSGVMICTRLDNPLI
jgi:hypothetical protein